MRNLYRFALFFVLVFSGTQMAAQSTENNFQNPMIRDNFPDPFILKEGDTYYAYSTNSNSRNVPVATSTDLINWDILRDVMPALATWVDLSNSNVWAPEVLKVEEEYLLFYTARDKNSDRQCIGLAVSDSPTGQFRDRSDMPFICQSEEGGSIDASPFRDDDGRLYLYWKNDGNCCMMATYLYVQELSPDGKSLVGEPVQLLRNELAWHGPVVEAPQLWKQEGIYYLFYSGNVYAGEAYAVGYAICETPLGPCTDAEENPILASDMESSPLVLGPGHHTLIRDEAGETWIVYHVWQVSGGRRTDTRQVWMDKIEWVEGRPVVRGPTREPQAAPAISSQE
jgi:beta-xylosidase